jgi:hypothetical protein
MLTPKKPHPLAKYVAGQVARHQQAARQQTDALGDAWTDTAIDQIPYVGNAKNAVVAGKHLYNHEPFQAATNLIKAHPYAKVGMDAALNHLEPLAAEWDEKVGTPVSKLYAKAAKKALLDSPTHAEKRKALTQYVNDAPARRAEGLESLNTFREGVTDAYRAGKKAAGFKRGGQWSFAEGGALERFDTGGGTKKKKAPLPAYTKGNLNDFIYTQDDLDYMNNLPRDERGANAYCPTGDCLKVANQAYDERVGRRFASNIFPTTESMKKELGIQSSTREIYERMSPAQQAKLRQIPYMNPDASDFTVDSWDMAGVTMDAGGKSFFADPEVTGRFHTMSEEERRALYRQIPVGATIGMGGEKVGTTSGAGYNSTHGMANNRHSGRVVGYTEDGVPVMYDYTGYTRLDDPTFGTDMPITNITAPASVADRNWEWLEKQGILRDELSPLELDTSRLENADRSELNKFVSSLSHNKPALMNQLGMSNNEYDKLAKALTGISMQETKGGANWKYNLEGVAQFFGMNIGDTHGMTQLNFDNIKENPELAQVAKQYGITSARALRKPWNAAIASMIYAKSNKFMSQQNLQDGQAPGERVFTDPGVSLRDFIPGEELGTFSSDGFYVDESNDRVPVLGTSMLGIGAYREPEEIQQDLDRKAPGIYRVRKNEEGEMEITKKTKGNQAGSGVDGRPIDDLGAFIYSWQSPNAVKTGDALGKSKYYRNVLEAMAKMGAER